MGTTVAPTGDASIDGILWGWKWQSPNLTFRFPVSAAEFAYSTQGFEAFSSLQASQIVNFGLNNLSVFSGLTFTFDPNFGGGNLRFAKADFVNYGSGAVLNPNPHGPGGGRSAEGNPPDNLWVPAIAQGDTWYIKGGYESPLLGTFEYAAGLLHEVGHALGLKHGHVTQPPSWNTNITLPALPTNEDTQEYSIMTYRAFVGQVTPGGSKQGEYPWNYMINDHAALQYMYGANFGPGSNNTNTVYSFDNTGSLFIDDPNIGTTPEISTGASYHGKVLLTLWDGGGYDTYNFSNYSNNQSIDLRPGEFSTFSTAQLSDLALGIPGAGVHLARGNVANPLLYNGDLRSLIEDAIAGTGNDTIIGNQIANRLYGNVGNDVLRGEAGGDLLDGGVGNDAASYTNSSAGVVIFLSSGGNAASANGGHATGDVLVSIESVLGSGFRDILIGNEGGNVLSGLSGDDDLGGGAGNDILIGGDGTDILVGGPGADSHDGGAGFDIAIFLGSSAGVTVNLAAGSGTGGDANGDTFASVETIIASNFGDLLTGSSSANFLLGKGGNDIFIGSAGGDIIIGGHNAATDAGVDSITYSGFSNEIAVNLLNNSAQGLDIGADQLFGIENVVGTTGSDLLRGDNNGNSLSGKEGGDLMFGEGGNDVLVGGSNGDVMTGGAGLDRFVFDKADVGSNNIVTDFNQSGDDDLLFTGFGASFDFSDFTLAIVNSSDVNVTATGWSGSVYLQGAAGLVDASDFAFV